MSTLGSRALSVRGRITLAVTILFAVAMAFGGWFLIDRAEAAWVDDLRAQDLAELELLARDLAALEMLADGLILPVGTDGTAYTLIDEQGTVVGATPLEIFAGGVVFEGEVPLGSVPDEVIERLAESQGAFEVGEIITVSLPVALDQGTLTLTAQSSLGPIQSGVDALRDILLILIPLLALGVGAMTWFVTGRAFRPVEAITEQVERITDGRLDERIPVPDSRDEVAHLATTMNTMLDRLSAGRRRQQQFVSDASHELRNPVATSKVKLEVALAHADSTDWEDTARVVLEEQERLGAMVDDLLLLARLDEGRAADRAELDLDDVVFAEAARPQAVTVDVSAVMPVRISGDERQLTLLVRNLISNAVRHAEGRVTIVLKQSDSKAELVVVDDGPGIRAEDWDRVFERFVRLEDARTRDGGGAGLGLALVDAVAKAHGGSARVADADEGGARFEVRLPLTEIDAASAPHRSATPVNLR